MVARQLGSEDCERLGHYERMCFWAEEHARQMHPEYGGCDAFADGACTECLRIKAERDEYAAEVRRLKAVLLALFETLESEFVDMEPHG